MAQSLKVPTALLITNAEAKRKSIIAAHKKAKREYAVKNRAYVRRLATFNRRLAEAKARDRKRLALAIQRANVKGAAEESGSWQGGQYRRQLSLRVTVPCCRKPIAPTKPERPSSVANTERVDRHLRLLRVAAQESISVRTTDDFAAYL